MRKIIFFFIALSVTLAQAADTKSDESKTLELLMLPGMDKVPVFRTEDSLKQLLKLQAQLQEKITDQKVNISSGTEAVLIEGTQEKCHVRPLAGPYQGKDLWLLRPCVEPLGIVLLSPTGEKKAIVWGDLEWDPRDGSGISYSASSKNIEAALAIAIHDVLFIPKPTKVKWIEGDLKIAKIQIIEGEQKGKTVGTFTEQISIPNKTRVQLCSVFNAPALKSEQAIDALLDVGMLATRIINDEADLVKPGTEVRCLSVSPQWRQIKVLSGNQTGLEGWILTPCLSTAELPGAKEESSRTRLFLKHAANASLPSYSVELKGSNEIRIRNPNDFSVLAGVRSGDKGKDFKIPKQSVQSIKVPNGRYDIFFVYSNQPDALFQGDGFTLKNSGVEIHIVKVEGGNYDIRRVK
jgi:hypothetical protein